MLRRDHRGGGGRAGRKLVENISAVLKNNTAKHLAYVNISIPLVF